MRAAANYWGGDGWRMVEGCGGGGWAGTTQPLRPATMDLLLSGKIFSKDILILAFQLYSQSALC